MTGLAILLGGAALAYGVSRWLDVPVIPLFLIIGFLMSALELLPEAEILEQVLVLGLSFLLFAAGSELDLARVGQLKGVALRVGLIQFFTLALVGYGSAVLLGFSVSASLYLALALAASSTLVVMRILQRRRQAFEPFGRMLVGVLLLQDLLVIVSAPVLNRLLESSIAAVTGFVLTMALIAFAYTLRRWVLPRLVITWELSHEALLVTALGTLSLFIALTAVLDLPTITGAFLAGVAFSRFPLSGLVREQLTSLTDFFLAIFFTVLGGLVVVPTLNTLLIGVVFMLVVVLITPPLVTVVAEYSGFSARAALEGGLLLAQTSEFSLVVGLQALIIGVIEQEIFSVIVLVTVLTMILTPFLATTRNAWVLLRLHPSRMRGRSLQRPREHILILGCGESGRPLIETLFFAGYPIFVVDDDPAVIDHLQRNGVPGLRGDASDPEILYASGAHDARAIVSMIRRPKDNQNVLQGVHHVPVFVRVFTEEDAVFIAQLGGIPVRYAKSGANAFLNWFDRTFGGK